jgi:hypothetical protein
LTVPDTARFLRNAASHPLSDWRRFMQFECPNLSEMVRLEDGCGMVGGEAWRAWQADEIRGPEQIRFCIGQKIFKFLRNFASLFP